MLIDWINDVLVGERIIVKDLAEDLYDGQVLQKLFGETLNRTRQVNETWMRCAPQAPEMISPLLRLRLHDYIVCVLTSECVGVAFQKSWRVRSWTWQRWPSRRSPRNRSCRRFWNASTTRSNSPPGAFAGMSTVRMASNHFVCWSGRLMLFPQSTESEFSPVFCQSSAVNWRWL